MLRSIYFIRGRKTARSFACRVVGEDIDVPERLPTQLESRLEELLPHRWQPR